MKASVLPTASPLERHLTPAELAQAWQVDQTTIRRMFLDEPGVLKIGQREARGGRRSYVTLRIPEAVAERVYRSKCK